MAIDVSKLSPGQRSVRQAIRAFLLCATDDELARELALSLESGDGWRAQCVAELIAEGK